MSLTVGKEKDTMDGDFPFNWKMWRSTNVLIQTTNTGLARKFSGHKPLQKEIQDE